MFNFSKNKSELRGGQEITKPTKPVEQEEESVIDLETQEDSEVAKKAIANVLEYYKKIIEIGGNFDVAQIEQIAGMPLNKFIEALEKNPVKIELSSKELLESLKNIMTQSKQRRIMQWIGDKFRGSVTGQVTFIFLMLLLKFAPDLQAMDKGVEIKDEVGDKTEMVKENQEDDDGTTYQAEAADFEGDKLDSEMNYEDFERYSKLDLSNYFDTDKADISPDDLGEITDSFTKFLNTINSDNYEQVKATVFKLLVSCDYRSTKNWEDGNEGLAKARFKALETALQEILTNYDFADSGLSEGEIKDIQSKGFVLEMPDNGVETGVTLISDLINPDTGEYYTDQEREYIKKNDPEKYDNLLAQCRYVKAEFLSPKPVDNLEKLAPLKAEFKLDLSELEQRESSVPQFGNFSKVTVGVDNSGSMAAREAVKRLVEKQTVLDTELTVRTFSSSLDKGETKLNLAGLVDFVENQETKGDSRELAVHSAHEILKNLSEPADTENNLVVMLTDEALQGITWQLIKDMKAEAELKNAEVIFIIAHSRGGGAQEIISLNDLEIAYFKLHWEDMNKLAEGIINTQGAKIANLEKVIDNNNKVLDFHKQRLDRNLDKKTEREAENIITKRGANIESYQNQINQAQEIVSALKTAQDEGDPVKLMQALEDNGGSFGDRSTRIGGGSQQFATVE